MSPSLKLEHAIEFITLHIGLLYFSTDENIIVDLTCRGLTVKQN